MSTTQIRAEIPATDPRCSETVDMTAEQVDRITDRQLADDLAIAVQDLVNAFSKLRWCFNCRAADVGGGARGGCPTCIAYLQGMRMVAKAQAVRA